MNKKAIVISSFIIVIAAILVYTSFNYLIAGNRDGKTCTQSSCSQQTTETKAGGDLSSYEFVTDKACSDEMKSSLKSELMGIEGVKDVKFGMSCNVSKMTQVSVMYSAGETSQETLASFLKDKNYDCSGSGCEKNGNCTGKKKDGRNI